MKRKGVQLATMQNLARYWADYEWRKVEARINAVPNFITEIDGLDIHFIHVRSKEKNALPLIITHGWPGSFIEQMKVIAPLTDPVAYGGKAVFPDEIYAAPRNWAERAYPKLIYFNKLDKGGHFAAWEQPELFVREMRLGFAKMRTF